MSDELLPYYNRELAFIRRMGKEFGAAHPRIAGGLNLDSDAAEDPHVSRLVESFAFLNARLRKKLDDDFPEISDALLTVLYPHYLSPFPSASIAQFTSEDDLTEGHRLPAGTALETNPVQGEACRFRTTSDIDVWPVNVMSGKLGGRPLVAPEVPGAERAIACIRLQLECCTEDNTFAGLAPKSLRFYLHGQRQHTYPLYELIHNNTVQVAIGRSPDDPNRQVLGPQSIRPVGFDRDEGLIPMGARSFVGYRLLSEFFAFPEKFLFFELTGLGARVLAGIEQHLEIFIYLDKTLTDVEQSVTKDTFRLGCAPISNLFRQRAEPIRLDHHSDEYRIVPDARRPNAMEVFSIERVTATAPDGSTREFAPFHSVNHSVRDEHTAFWHTARRPARRQDGRVDHGTEVFLSVADLELRPADAAEWVLDVETLCVNRDLPARLPFGGGEPTLRLSGGSGAIAAIECLLPPTPTRRRALGNSARWQLISHLSLGHLTLEDAHSLQEVLRLYNTADSAQTRAMIEGLCSVSHSPTTGRAPTGGIGGICRGLEVTLEFDPQAFHGSGLFLFASVLERFLGQYCSINSFVRTVARVRGKEGVLRRWPPRAGDATLL